jgi:hypothetical protein
VKLGKEKLTQLKTKVRDLALNVNKIVYEELNDPNIWWHVKPQTKVDQFMYPYEKYGNALPEILNKPLRRILGILGPVLSEFGYGIVVNPTYPLAVPEGWFITDGYGVKFYPKPKHVDDELGARQC